MISNSEDTLKVGVTIFVRIFSYRNSQTFTYTHTHTL